MRRGLLLSSALLILNLAASGAEQPDAPLPVVDPAPAVTAIIARNTLKSIGVCGGYGESPQQYAKALDYLKVRLMRGGYVHHGGTDIEKMKATRDDQKVAPAFRVKFYCLTASYLNDLMPWDKQQPFLLEMASAGLLWGISGPNEINNLGTGNGSRGPNDAINKTAYKDYPANALDWANKLADFRAANRAALAGVLISGPDLAPIAGGAKDYPASLNISGLADYFDFHYYAGGGHQPGLPAGINAVVGYFGNVHVWARSAWGPHLQGILSECGAATDGKAYAKDGISQAKYTANQQLDAFSVGCRAVFTYQLFDGNSASDDSEANYGLFLSDKTTPKPSGVILRRMQDLRSLHNNADDPANVDDNAPFMPGCNPQSFSVTGMTFVPTSGTGVLFEHKSDGSTLIWLWNEPPINKGNVSLTPAADPVKVTFPRARAYRVHDLMSAESLTTPAFTTGASVTVTLAGYPMAIELAPPQGYNRALGDPAGP